MLWAPHTPYDINRHRLEAPGTTTADLYNRDMPGRSQEDRALRQKRAQPNVDDDAGASAHDAAQTWR